ncbi:MAG: hypothetical protein WA865_04710 [Spirulinaceae cyanobacterium]
MNSQNYLKTTAKDKTLAKLKGLLKDFDLQDIEGNIVGKVRDVERNAKGSLNLVISQLHDQQTSEDNLFILNSKYVKKIQLASESLLIETNPQLEPYQLNGGSAEEINEEGKEVVDEAIIRLLEERLVVERTKHKVGEVVMRKEIGTRMIQVPVRWEKLIVEQVEPSYKQLAEIDLAEGEVTEEIASVATVEGKFLSPQAASDLLETIAMQTPHGCASIKVEIILDNPQLQEKYQTMFNLCTK